MLVGLGGAVGSMLRYGLGLLSVSAWGSSFPWGTILINVGGSFLIGLVGAGTVADGFLPASPALRLFIMVGICGGFTTFSSFSLQTLDLVRDGRTGAGLLNVGLSVLLCFGAVSAGHHAGAGLGHRKMAMDLGPARQTHAVLALLEKPERVAGQLAAAAWMAGLYGGGGIEALAVRAEPPRSDMPTENVRDAEQAEATRQAEQARVLEVRRAVETWTASGQGKPVHWSERQGDVASLVARAGSEAGLVVLGQPAGDDAGAQRSHDALHAALFDAGRPVLMLPETTPEKVRFAGGRVAVIAVAWKDDASAHRAVQAAMPLLRRAGRVVLLNEPGLMATPAIFRGAGIAVELGVVPGSSARADTQAGGRLLSAAREAEAELLVMGAFAHAPLRERLLGGVTRHIVSTAGLPVFMQH